MFFAQVSNGPAILTDGVAASAARDFYSGVMYGWTLNDVKFEMDTCFPDDQELSDLIDTAFDQYASNDLDAANDTMSQASGMFSEDVKDCSDNLKVMAGVNAMAELASAFMAQDDWESVMEQNYWTTPTRSMDTVLSLTAPGRLERLTMPVTLEVTLILTSSKCQSIHSQLFLPAPPVTSTLESCSDGPRMMLSTRWTRVSQMTRICLN